MVGGVQFYQQQKTRKRMELKMCCISLKNIIKFIEKKMSNKQAFQLWCLMENKNQYINI